MSQQLPPVSSEGEIAFEKFDVDIAHPLKGLRSELKNGTIPKYVQPPKIRSVELVDLFDIDHEQFRQKVLDDEFQQGIEIEHLPTLPPEFAVFTVHPKTYLNAYRDAARRRKDNSAYKHVDFCFQGTHDPDSSSRSHYGTIDQVADPLRELMQTDSWRSRTSTIHGGFDGWYLRYHVGDMGALTDVSAVAKFRSKSATGNFPV